MKTPELKKFLKQRAKEMKSDFNDVPEWVIKASVEFFNKKQEDEQYVNRIGNFISSSEVEEDRAIVKFLQEADEDVLSEFAHGFEFHDGKGNVIEISMWEPLEHFTLRQLAEAIGLQ